MYLSKHFTLEELTFSEAAKRLNLNNEASEAIQWNLQRLCHEILEPIRELLGKPILINSAYRSPDANAVIGGSRTSEHMDGRAADIRVPGMTPLEVCTVISENSERLEIGFNQLILEFGSWTHISVPVEGSAPKYQRLTAKRVDGKVLYLSGIQA